jgi:hypothetical protein
MDDALSGLTDSLKGHLCVRTVRFVPSERKPLINDMIQGVPCSEPSEFAFGAVQFLSNEGRSSSK